MADYPILYPNDRAVPTTTGSAPDNALNLTIPGSVLTGQMAGIQQASTFMVVNPVDKSKIGFGLIPGTTTNEYGFFCVDSSGNLIMKIVNGTWYVYDVTNNKNVMQSGKLPDTTYGWAVAAVNKNVTDGF